MMSVTGWVKAGRCDTSACVEVAAEPDMVLVRNPDRPDIVMDVDHDAWESFREAILRGEFDEV